MRILPVLSKPKCNVSTLKQAISAKMNHCTGVKLLTSFLLPQRLCGRVLAIHSEYLEFNPSKRK